MKNHTTKRDELTRRGALGFLAGAGAVIAFGCGDDDIETAANTSDAGASDATVANGDGSAATTDGATCASTPEGEVGPYFADDSDARFNRSNILSNLDGTGTQTGVPLTLTIFVLDAKNACAPYVNAQIDIWHCNADGVYSDQASESTSTEQWLRGYQLTDANGKVTFTTVMPGWYSGRTTHIHLRVRSSYDDAAGLSDGTNTTQLFFAQTVDDNLSTNVTPYSAEGKNPTTNAGDHVYAGEENGANVLAVTGDTTNGFVAAVTIFLPIAAATGTTTSNEGGPGGGPMGGGIPDGAAPFDGSADAASD